MPEYSNWLPNYVVHLSTKVIWPDFPLCSHQNPAIMNSNLAYQKFIKKSREVNRINRNKSLKHTLSYKTFFQWIFLTSQYVTMLTSFFPTVIIKMSNFFMSKKKLLMDILVNNTFFASQRNDWKNNFLSSSYDNGYGAMMAIASDKNSLFITLDGCIEKHFLRNICELSRKNVSFSCHYIMFHYFCSLAFPRLSWLFLVIL